MAFLLDSAAFALLLVGFRGAGAVFVDICSDIQDQTAVAAGIHVVRVIGSHWCSLLLPSYCACS
jgi:hypothetical protein